MSNLFNISDQNIMTDGTVTGNLTGNVTGNVTGNLTGEINGAKLDSNATGVGFNGTTPIAKPASYTQTFATADKTHAARTAIAVATDAAATSAFGYTEAQANAIVTNLNALIVDVADTASLLNALLDDIQAYGLLA